MPPSGYLFQIRKVSALQVMELLFRKIVYKADARMRRVEVFGICHEGSIQGIHRMEEFLFLLNSALLAGIGDNDRVTRPDQIFCGLSPTLRLAPHWRQDIRYGVFIQLVTVLLVALRKVPAKRQRVPRIGNPQNWMRRKSAFDLAAQAGVFIAFAR